jgi:GH15 family glucan-1,4-alpha-glucosidase
MTPLEDYAIIGDTHSVALVTKSGSIDWLCFPRADSPACFAALLGKTEHGAWRIAPVERVLAVKRRYVPGTLVLETEWRTQSGVVRLTDFMPPRQSVPDVVRIVTGISGSVRLRMELVVRFDYGSIVPWVRACEGATSFIGGPDALELRTPAATRGEGLSTVADIEVRPGTTVPFVLTWHPSHEAPPKPIDPDEALTDTVDWWLTWSSRCTFSGPYREEVTSSLVVLKALTHRPSGGVLAAATTSLPEKLGGTRNWDYRFCWLRDATFTLYALMANGFREESRAWRDWLLRAVAGDTSKIQIMYGSCGERRLDERELDWLPGYAGSRPVRVGNAAAGQLQLDVYGELMDSMFQARKFGLAPDRWAWSLQRSLMDALEGQWEEPDSGIWEVRGPSRHFTHSKVMAWVAFDRAVSSVEKLGLEGPLDRWRRRRAEIHAEVCRKGIDPERGCFTQSYGSKNLDASLLMLPLVGFLPVHDERVQRTVAAIEDELLVDGLVLRYRTEHVDDGLPSGEGVFLACSFWLADVYARLGRMREARALYERLLALRNDVGLLSEEFDPRTKRLIGNFPQAFSHVGLVNTARNLLHDENAPAEKRAEE